MLTDEEYESLYDEDRPTPASSAFWALAPLASIVAVLAVLALG